MTRALLATACLLNIMALWLALYWSAPAWAAITFGIAGLAAWAGLMRE